ncbi:MAG: hypothetical protein AAFR61_15200 [Bacteroidota bacterium]
MFHTIDTIWKTLFTPRYRNNQAAKDLIWLLIVIFAFSMVLTAWVAFASFARYRAMLESAEAFFSPVLITTIAALLTSLIAGTVLLAGSVGASVIVRSMAGVPIGINKPVQFLTFMILFLIAALDYSVTIEGARDIIETRVQHRKGAILAESQKGSYEAEIAQLEVQVRKIDKRYTWKGNFVFKPYPTTSNSKAQFKKDQQVKARLEHYRQLKVQEDQLFQDRKTEHLSQVGSSGTTLVENLVLVTRLAYAGIFFLQLLLSGILIHYQVPEQSPRPKPRKARKNPFGFLGNLLSSKGSKNSTVTAQDKGKMEGAEIGFKTQGGEGPKIENLNPGLDPHLDPEFIQNLDPQAGGSKRSKNWANFGSKRDAKNQKLEGPNSPVLEGANSPDLEGQKNRKLEGANSPVLEGAKNYFFASKAPENLGKKYNTSPAALKKLERVHSSYISLQDKSGEVPTLNQVAQASGMSINTARKYLEMLELKTKGQA